MNKNTFILGGCALAVLAGCAVYTPPTEQETQAVIKSSFSARSIAKLDRLEQSQTQAICSETRDHPSKEQVALIEKLATSSIKYPADGKYLGDWKRGEQIAQRGTGFQFSDDPKGPVGANCYACHQLTKAEISYGTIGPSLYNFGKLRGFTPDMQKYAWGKVYDAHAYAACSNMPRFGVNHVLTIDQIKDLVALVMSPDSPVNK